MWLQAYPPTAPRTPFCSAGQHELAGHRRSGPRCDRPADLRLPDVGALRPDADHHLLGDRRRRGCGAGLFRRLDRSSVPALHRDMDIDSLALLLLIFAAVLRAGTSGRCSGSCCCFQLGCACGPGAGGVPARAQPSNMCAPHGRWAVGTARSCSATCCPTPWWRRDLLAVHPVRLDHHADLRSTFLGFGLPPGSPSLGELLAQGKATCKAPWLGLTGFLTISIMLSLLIFIGEAVRDAFDPRKTFEG
jgi:hypothetical protein